MKERKFEDQVRRLIIYYENQPERALKAMVYYCKLEEIVLFDSRMARKEMVVFYLDNFPHLKKIEMNCLNDFDTSCIEKIMKNQRHHHIETLFVGPNYHGNMASLDDKQWFVEETAKQRTGGLTIADQTVLMGLFPNLQNIWLS